MPLRLMILIEISLFYQISNFNNLIMFFFIYVFIFVVGLLQIDVDMLKLNNNKVNNI